MTDTGKRAPNMYDVAALAGVSHQTVSRVINDAGAVAVATRARVEAAIDELGYRRNVAARTLATRRTRAIGVLTPTTTDFGPSSTLYAVEQATRAAGYQPLITSTAVDAASVRESLGFLLDQSIEALVVIAPYQVVVDELDRVAGLPPTVLLQTGDPRGLASVAVDQTLGAELAARHLVELGHVRIQQIVGRPDYLEARVRRDAINAALERAGVAPGPALSGDWTADSGYACADQLDATTTAVICGNDQMALGLIHALVQRGRRVPEDMSIVSFDDIPEAAHCLPPLTTVHQDFGDVGRRAVDSLVTILEGGIAAPPISIEPWLVVRESTARR